MRESAVNTAAVIDWTNVVNFDSYGSILGYDTVEKSELDIDEARANGATIDEWHVADLKHLPIRVVRIAAPTFLDIYVFPAECPYCGAPVTSLKWISDEHHPKCPRRDPHF